MKGVDALAGVSVVVSTTRTAGALASAAVPKGHFTHIVIDEAAQLMESEALLPLSLAGADTSVVMAGDPQQLGPSTFSKVESVHGLHVSIMERLATLPAYQGDAAPRTCARLTLNYRSHPALVNLLSKISYSNTLVPKAPKAKVEALSAWSKRGSTRTHPLLFCAVEGGVEEREGDSPSFFNRQEAVVISDLISELLAACGGGGSFGQEHIGVITPFYKQSQKVRQLLRSRGLGGVKVGSTEEFHGHECTALFVTTVRTSKAQLEYDEQYDTGFVGHAKRFNTALSRAVALAVVVGDASVLSAAPEWQAFIASAKDNSCYRTVAAPALPPAPAPAPAPPPPAAPAPPADAAAVPAPGGRGGRGRNGRPPRGAPEAPVAAAGAADATPPPAALGEKINLDSLFSKQPNGTAAAARAPAEAKPKGPKERRQKESKAAAAAAKAAEAAAAAALVTEGGSVSTPDPPSPVPEWAGNDVKPDAGVQNLHLPQSIGDAAPGSAQLSFGLNPSELARPAPAAPGPPKAAAPAPSSFPPPPRPPIAAPSAVVGTRSAGATVHMTSPGLAPLGGPARCTRRRPPGCRCRTRCSPTARWWGRARWRRLGRRRWRRSPPAGPFQCRAAPPATTCTGRRRP